jgi:PIN domain nuclease of toxin-antitoxin system
MRFLLDTHAFLWFVDGNPQLSIPARSMIDDSDNQPVLSVASLWEMAIKISLGRLTLTRPFQILVPEQLALNGIALLGITIDHAAEVSRLPFHHRDPFDRLLVAQTLVEQIPIVSSDKAFDAYPVKRLW